MDINNIYLCFPVFETPQQQPIIFYKEDGMLSGDIFAKGNIFSGDNVFYAINYMRNNVIPYIILSNNIVQTKPPSKAFYEKYKYGTGIKLIANDEYSISKNIINDKNSHLFKIIRDTYIQVADENFNAVKIPCYLVKVI